jgi:hypothetical protein
VQPEPRHFGGALATVRCGNGFESRDMNSFQYQSSVLKGQCHEIVGRQRPFRPKQCAVNPPSTFLTVATQSRNSIPFNLQQFNSHTNRRNINFIASGLNSVNLENFGILYSRVGTGEPESRSRIRLMRRRNAKLYSIQYCIRTYVGIGIRDYERIYEENCCN